METIAEKIHREIDNECRKIMEASLCSTEKPNNFEIYSSVREKGFVNSINSKKVVDFYNDSQKKHVALYYLKKYPLLKFIQSEEFFKILNKYNLIYSNAENYIGNIPLKNAKEIADCEIDEYDLISTIYKATLENAIEKMTLTFKDKPPMSDYHIKEVAERHGMKPWAIATTVTTKEYKKNGYYIAADKSQFNLTNTIEDESGFGFVAKPTIIVKNPDPIVFRFVKEGILIITKWGAEANDTELTVPKLN